jgi:hypothetical protein
MMDEGDSSGAGAIPDSIKRAYLLLLSEPRQEQEQRQLEAVVEQCGKDAALSQRPIDYRST